MWIATPAHSRSLLQSLIQRTLEHLCSIPLWPLLPSFFPSSLALLPSSLPFLPSFFPSSLALLPSSLPFLPSFFPFLLPSFFSFSLFCLFSLSLSLSWPIQHALLTHISLFKSINQFNLRGLYWLKDYHSFGMLLKKSLKSMHKCKLSSSVCPTLWQGLLSLC
jgi:hypothetical protein